MAWDFYRGGRHVVAPERPAREGSVRFWRQGQPRADAVADGADAIATNIERVGDRRLVYELFATNSYIQSHVREALEEYQDRIARAMHVPLFRSIVDIYVSAIMRTGPDRGRVGADGWLGEYHANTDLCGSSIDEFMAQALTYSLIYKRSAIVTDRPRLDRQPVSMADQIAAGDRPYSYHVPPQDVVDWSLDSHGRFRWVRIREQEPDQRDPTTGCTEPRIQYRVWYPDRYEVWRKTDAEGKKTEWRKVKALSGTHPVGEVPVVMLFARRGHESRRTLEADGLLTDVLYGDKAIYNLLSLFHDQIYSQCFSQLAVPTENGEAPDLELGLKRVLGFVAEGGARPMYLSPEADLLHAQLKIIGEHIGWIRQLASVSRGRAEYSKEERSAAALSMESADKNNAVASLAGAAESADRAIHRHAAAWMGDKPGEGGLASYSRDVSLKALSAQIADATSLAALQIPQAAMRELYRPLLVRAMREQGQGEDAIARAIDALEAAGETMTASIAEGIPDASA